MLRSTLVAALLIATCCAKDSSQRLSAVTTSRFNVPANPTITLDRSFGEIEIQGWDRPEVEITVTRTSGRYLDAEDRAAAQRRFDSVKVDARQEGGKVTVATTYPPQNWLLHPLERHGDVVIEYEIHAPRDASFVLDHNRGGVNVSGIRGSIHATVTSGQITLLLARGAYSIDARCGTGKVYSDFEGHDRERHLIGESFTSSPNNAGANLYLRARFGDIVMLQPAGE